MKMTGSIEIERPIQEVFDYTVNNVAEWSLVVVEDEPLDDKPLGVGSTFRFATEERGHRMEFTGEVARHDPPTAHVAEMKSKQFDITGDYTFESLGDARTRVTLRSTVQPKTFFIKLLFFVTSFFVNRANCKATAKELQSLKKLLEGGAANQPDA